MYPKELMIILHCLMFAVAVLGMLFYHRMRVTFQYLSWYLLVLFLGQAVSDYAAHVFRNNLPVLHALSILLVPFYALMYDSMLISILVRRIMLKLYLFTILTMTYVSFEVDRLATFPAFNLYILGFAVIVSSVIALSGIMKSESPIVVLRQSEFWLLIVLFFYNSSTLAIYGAMLYFNERDMVSVYINNALIIVGYISALMYAFTIILEVKTRKLHEPG